MHRKTSKLLSVFVICFMLLGLAPGGTQPAGAISPGIVVVDDIVISQVYGGGGNSGATYTNDYIELFNQGAIAVNLSGWSVQYASSTGSSWSKTNIASGTIQPGGYFLIQEAQGAGGTLALPTPDAIGTLTMSGTAGKVALVNNQTTLSGTCPSGLMDFLGFGSLTNCSETTPTVNLSNTTAAKRNLNGCTDTNNNSADFTIANPTADPTPRNTASPLNTCPSDTAPAVSAVSPANGTPAVPVGTDIVVTFNEDVTTSGIWYDLTCTSSGTVAATVSGGPSVYTINPDADLTIPEDCTLTIYAAQVSDTDLIDPPNNMEADFTSTFNTTLVCDQAFTPIYDIQGSDTTSPINNTTVTTEGIVVSDNEGASPTLRGFYLQDVTGDANPATSDGIFVYNGSNNNVALGDIVRVTGTAEEFQGQTQISSVSSIISCDSGTLAPTDISLPFANASEAEQYEGMLVRFNQTLFVSEHYLLGRFGQVTLSGTGRLYQPTGQVLPGAAAIAMQAVNDLNRIILDDSTQNQNPDPILFGRGGLPLSASNTLRGGDTITGLVGVFTYTWGGNSASPNAYRIRPVNALGGGIPNFVAANPRPSTAEDVGGTLKVAGMNLLNYFNTFGLGACTNGVSGSATDCRGADNATEFTRQSDKTINAILAMNVDVLGIVEIENDGYGGSSAIQDLVNKVNAIAGAGTYAFIDVDNLTGILDAMGSDAIKVGFLYKPAMVAPVGTTSVLNTVEFVNGGDSGARNRVSLLQAFQDVSTGATFIANVNHLKSKGSACDSPDALDGQGNCSIVRTNAANELAAWIATDPTGTGQPDVIILGDLNSYAMEDPIGALETAGFTNMVLSFGDAESYSYVFDGQWGYLDYAMGTDGLLSQVSGVTEFHINSDEPSVLDYNTNFKNAGQIISLYSPDAFRVSDHDPILVGLNLDGTAPTLNLPANMTVLPSGPAGAVVNFTVTASDNLDPAPVVVCTPPSGSTFPIATTTVNCTATDAAGNSSSGSFTVTVGGTAYTLSLRSYGPYDGTMRESTEFSGVSNFVEAASFLITAGDDAFRRHYMGMLDFNTSSLPDGAIITAATLQVKVSYLSPNLYTMLGDLMAEVATPYFGTLPNLQTLDFASAAAANAGNFSRAASGNTWITLNMDPASLFAVDPTGRTQFRLCFMLDDSNDTLKHNIRIFSGNYLNAAYRPLLTITYYLAP